MANLVLAFAELLVGAIVLDAGVKGSSVSDVVRGQAQQNPISGLGGGGSSSSSGGAAGSSAGASIGGIVSKAYGALTPGRRDQGVDYSGTGNVGAVADGTVTHVGLWPGWPGTGGIVYKTAQGYVYVMEHFTPAAGLKVGDTVKKGQVIGNAPGGYPYIETGFANSSSSGPLTPYNGSPDGTPMPGSFAFTKAFGLGGF